MITCVLKSVVPAVHVQLFLLASLLLFTGRTEAGVPDNFLFPDMFPFVEVDAPSNMKTLQNWSFNGSNIVFNTMFANQGDGLFEIRRGDDLNDGSDRYELLQRVYIDNDDPSTGFNFQDFSIGSAEIPGSPENPNPDIPGRETDSNLIWFENFAKFSLHEAPVVDGVLTVGAEVASNIKSSWRLSSNRGPLPGFGNPPAYNSPDKAVQQRISTGYADLYTASTGAGGQFIDISGVPAGPSYWLRQTVDPSNRIQETDETNNSFEILIDLNNPGEAILFAGQFVQPGDAAPTVFGDLNSDGNIDLLDWNLYTAGLGVDLTGLTAAEALQLGDLTGDFVNDHDDFLAFKEAFEAANGVGSFEGLTASVPEPSAFLLGLLCLVGLFASRFRSLRPAMSTAVVAIVCMTVLVGPANAQLVGLWEFENSGNLTLASAGSDLVATGSDTFVAGSGGADTGAASLDLDDFYTVINPIGANGGGLFTNQYTIVMDINDSSSGFNALLDMSLEGDADIFINGAGGIGISGDYAGVVNDGQWHRLAFSFELGSATALTRYIDGVSFGTVNVSDPSIDGRFGLQNTFTAFSDNGGGEESTTSISNLALFGTNLNSLQIDQLGVAGDPIIFADPKLTLEVNKTTGRMRVINKSGFDFSEEFNFYEISSDGGALNESGWFSFSDQGLDSTGPGTDQNWIEGGGSDANLLTEAYLAGGSAFDDTDSVILGTSYDPSVFGASDGDLVFSVFLKDSGAQIQGIVEYVTGSFAEADYDEDGNVDAADLQTWQTAFGSSPGGDTNGDGDTDGSDFLTWQQQVTSSGPLSAGIAVPEPSSLGMLAVSLSLLLAGRRK